ncbi:MAG TPA: hypothetical protein VIL69_24840, partial [Roseomonas sp.]
MQDWLARRRAQIEVFYLRAYSPELNPGEGLNGSLEQAVPRMAPARSREELKRNVVGHIRKLSKLPAVVSAARMRSMLIPTSLALPYHNRQRRRSTSSAINAFATARFGPTDDRAPATCVRCCSRMATWNQPRIGSPSMPALRRRRRSPGHPSVNAVSAVPSVRPTASRLRRISTADSLPVLATAPKTCRRPVVVSTLP